MPSTASGEVGVGFSSEGGVGPSSEGRIGGSSEEGVGGDHITGREVEEKTLSFSEDRIGRNHADDIDKYILAQYQVSGKL